MDNSWRELQPPRENSNKWNELMENGYIATDVLLNENTTSAINKLISETFSLNTEINWIILNGSVNKLKVAVSQVIMYNV